MSCDQSVHSINTYLLNIKSTESFVIIKGIDVCQNPVNKETSSLIKSSKSRQKHSHKYILLRDLNINEIYAEY